MGSSHLPPLNSSITPHVAPLNRWWPFDPRRSRVKGLRSASPMARRATLDTAPPRVLLLSSVRWRGVAAGVCPCLCEPRCRPGACSRDLLAYPSSASWGPCTRRRLSEPLNLPWWYQFDVCGSRGWGGGNRRKALPRLNANGSRAERAKLTKAPGRQRCGLHRPCEIYRRPRCGQAWQARHPRRLPIASAYRP
jgi:hypothetical protein